MHVSTDGAFKRCFGSDETLGALVKELCELPVIVAGGWAIRRMPSAPQRRDMPISRP